MDDTLTLREARARYFEDNGFGENGGYDDAWVDFKLGPIPFPFPNTAPRVRAVKYHDLHHVLTGYRTDFWGEMEISAWEIGAGCKDFVAAWQLNLGGMGMGALGKPRRTFRAFVRGRRSQSLYGRDFEPLLDLTVAEAREQIGVAREGEATPRASDYLLFAFAAGAGVMLGTIFFWLSVPLLPIAWLSLWVAKGRKTATAA